MILIDQEGGAVARLTPPQFRAAPPAKIFGDLARRDRAAAVEAAHLNARLFASELHPLGINVDCLPLLDVPAPGGHDIIGDRAFSTDPGLVADLGRAAAEGLLSGGVLPVAKHIPGHGRASADSHLALPVVDAPADDLSRTDFAPFHQLRDLPLAMTGHVVYSSIDPDRPATTSAIIIERVIRDAIGFDGLLMSDDISMEALDGSVGARARAALDAGCDGVLHCNGDMDEMTAIADNAGAISSTAEHRAQAAFAKITEPGLFDPVDGRERLDQLLGRA